MTGFGPRQRRGQSLVEVAIMLPALLLLLLGLIEFGNILVTSLAMTGYSREGANIAARGTRSNFFEGA